jgi:hypothetical protein
VSSWGRAARFAGKLGERLGETVAEIQARRVPPLAEVMEGLPRDVRLVDGERLDDNASPAEEHVALAHPDIEQ